MTVSKYIIDMMEKEQFKNNWGANCAKTQEQRGSAKIYSSGSYGKSV